MKKLGLLLIVVILALGVKLTSPGPVFFKQRRYGLEGEAMIWYPSVRLLRQRVSDSSIDASDLLLR